MASATLYRSKIAEPEFALWAAAVEELLTDVEKWSHEKVWTTRRFTVEVDEGFGYRPNAALEVDAGKGTLHFEPIAQIVAGAQGRVDFLVWPALYHAILLWKAKRNFAEEEWTLTLDSGIDWPNGWNQESYYTIAETLLRQA